MKPLIGGRTVAGLKAQDIEQLQKDGAADKSARFWGAGRGDIAREGKGVASRTTGMFGKILEFARRREIIAENPARAVKRLPEGRQTRHLTMAELEQETGGSVGLIAIRFLLTSLRRMEALAPRMAQVEAKARCIRFYRTQGIGAHEVSERIEAHPVDLDVLGFPLDRDTGAPSVFRPSGACM